MKLVVGLGNPGRKYQGTRHNVGYEVLFDLARRFGQGRPKSSFDGQVVDALLDGERALLLWPETFMNRSGQSVVKARDFYKLTNEDLLVVCDDLNLPLAKLRFRPKGSSGGQKGLEDIIHCLGTEEFSRLRVGIGEAPDSREAADYVLSKFAKDELSEIQQAVRTAADAVTLWARFGVEECMNQIN